MSILKIARAGHPVLKTPAKKVENPLDPAVSSLVRDMIETMQDAPGIGLAAPQVHVDKRVVVFYVPQGRTGELGQDGREEEDGPRDLTVLINPVIEPLTDEKVEGIEGCLSLPELSGLVPRYTRIRYKAVGLDGEPINVTASGFHARVVQHECDHLDGVLYPQRMEDLSTLGYAGVSDRMKLYVDEDEGKE